MVKRLFMETTRVNPSRTVGQIVSLLASSGARQVGMEYDGGQRLVGVKFSLEVSPNMFRVFSLPARTEPVFKLLNSRRKRVRDREKKAKQDVEQAESIAWRQLYRWCQAQLAIIQTGMVEAAEVFLPYMQNQEGRTLFEVMKDQGMKMLPGKKES